MSGPDEPNPDFRRCDGCDGEFYYGDLIGGDYCEDCHIALFPDDDKEPRP